MALKAGARAAPLRVLSVASELYPLAKVGGLGDVMFSLASALRPLGVDLRVAMPAYRGCLERLPGARLVREWSVRGEPFRLWDGTIEASGPAVWLLESPRLFDRPGTPYLDEDNVAWPDDWWRFGCFSEAVAQLAADPAQTGFDADVVHAHDWHAGLVIPWIRHLQARPTGMFTIHNPSYPGQFTHEQAQQLGLPDSWWHPEGIEFYGHGSALKAGIAYADTLTTVSPNYAREIQRPEHGFGLDGLLRARSAQLHGIRNGIDTHLWNPASDALIDRHYTASTVERGKATNKAALQKLLGLPADSTTLLIGMVTRLDHQKGADIVLAAAEELEHLPLQLAILGSGDRALEKRLADWAARVPERVAARIDHDEGLAHRIFAGADAFLMPSRFEPCGLTQMYAQRYGAIPLARRTGGLVDTVTDATPESLERSEATGVLFEQAEAAGVLYATQRALELRSQPDTWRSMQQAGMRRDFSWRSVAEKYVDLYRST